MDELDGIVEVDYFVVHTECESTEVFFGAILIRPNISYPQQRINSTFTFLQVPFSIDECGRGG